MTEAIREFPQTYDTGNPEVLPIELEVGEEEWDAIGKWHSQRRTHTIAKAAIQVDETHRLAEAEV